MLGLEYLWRWVVEARAAVVVVVVAVMGADPGLPLLTISRSRGGGGSLWIGLLLKKYEVGELEASGS